MAGIRRLARIGAIACLLALGAVASALAVGYGLLQTDSGRRAVAAWIAGAVSTPGQAEVGITGLTGALPGSVRIAAVTVKDASGIWLRADGLALDWRPLDLLSGRLGIDLVSARHVRLSRLPPDQGAGRDSAAFPWRLLGNIRVAKLLVDDVVLDAPVLGVAAAFRANGTFAAIDGARLVSSLAVVRTDGAKGHLNASASYHLGQDTLALDVSASEPAEGLAARLLDLPGLPAIAVQVQGAGPVRHWRGEASLSVDGLAAVTAALAVRGGRPYVVTAEGRGRAGKNVDAGIRGLAEPDLSFDLAVEWMPGESRLVLRHGRVASAALALTAEGSVDVAALTVRGTAEVEVRRSAALARYVSPFAASGASLSASVDGRIDRPAIKSRLSLTGLKGPAMMATAGELQLSAAPAGGARWRLDAQARLDRARFDDPVLAALAGQGGEGRIEGEVDPLSGAFEVTALRADLGNLTARASGRGNAKSRQGTAAIEIAVGNISPLSPVLDMTVGGSAVWKGDVSVGDAGVTARLQGRTNAFAIGDDTLAALLGASPALSGTVEIDRAGAVRLADVLLRGQHTRLSMESRLASPWRAMKGRYRLEVDDLTRFAKSLDVAASGRLSSEGTLDGPLDNPTLAGDLMAPSLVVEGQAVGRITGRYRIATPFSHPSGRADVAADSPAGRIEASSRLRLAAADRLDLSELSLRAEGATLGGDVVVSTRTGILTGRLRGRIDSLARASAVVDAPLSGVLDLDLQLRAQEGRQAAALKFGGRNIVAGRDLRLGAVAGRLTALGLNRDATLGLDLRVSRVGSSVGTVESASVSGRGGVAAFDLNVAAKGDLGGPFDLTAEGSVGRAAGRTRMAVNRLSGRLWKQAVALSEPGTLALDPDGLALALTGLSWGRASLSVAARSDRRFVSGNLSVQRIDASLIEGLLPGVKVGGEAALEARLSGAADAPEGEARLDLRNIKLSEGTDVGLPPLSGTVSARLRDGRLAVDGTVSGIGDTAIRARGEVPLHLDAAALTASMPRDGAMKGTFAWRGDLGTVSPLLPLPDHRFSGMADAALDVAGTVGRPVLKGRIEWRDGGYENLPQGTILRKVALFAEADEAGLTLRRATAEDGNGGRLSAGGTILLGADAAPVFDLQAELSKFTLVRRDDFTAVAGGRVALTGGPDKLVLQGRLDVARVEARIVESLPPELIELDVEEIGDGPDGAAERQRERAREPARPLRLDIEIAAPRRVFLRGRGLDSEWAGTLKVSGTADAPVVTGKLKPVRGQFDLAGKVFKLGEGAVSFDGGAKIDPALDIAAEHAARQVRATVRVTGKASKPKVVLSSVPELPQDEILARVLFDKSVGKLTPGEGVQLATTVATLTGLDGGGAGILDTIRGTLGVDTLRVGKTQDGETTVGVGKYVTKEVFVGVDQGATQKSGNVTVEVTVTPNVTVKSDIGADSQGKVGINWKWDY